MSTQLSRQKELSYTLERLKEIKYNDLVFGRVYIVLVEDLT